MSVARVLVAEPLRFLLPARDRHGELALPVDDASSLGHIVESAGIPRTEVGEFLVNGQPAAFTDRVSEDDVINVRPVRRPQSGNGRFLLDVHLGTLARRMRLLGLDTAYQNDADDPELVEQAVAENRTLLTQDRGLLRRRALLAGAYVRGSDPDDQLLDVLDRFDPPMQPWTRCLACNGVLERVDKAEVADQLEPGTRRSYDWFYQCQSCGRTYWRGAHASRLDAIIARAANATGRTWPVTD